MADDAHGRLRVGVVVPALDEAAGIGQTLDSACLDDARVAACIVADGGSRDATAARARDAGAIVIDAPRGRGLQLRAGWQALPPGLDAVLMLHADTRLPTGWLDAVESALGSGGRGWGAFDVRLDASATLRMVAGAMNLRSRLTGVCTGDQGIFARADALATAGGPPDWPLMEDIGLSDALRRAAGRPARPRLAVATSARRWHRDGPWRTIVRMWTLRARHAFGATPQALHRAYYGRPAPEAPPVAPAAAVVFTRLPEPGRVKRRLAAGIGEAAAFEAYRRLLARTLDAVDDLDRAARCERVLCVAPPAPDTPARALAAQVGRWLRPGWTLRWQQGPDLGARMHSALVDAARVDAAGGGRPAVLLGGDCPEIDADTLYGAIAALAGHDLAFVPTVDGGYGLVGLRQPCPAAFAGIAWGGPDVMVETRARLRALGRRWHEATPVRDIDLPEDWAWWQARAGV